MAEYMKQGKRSDEPLVNENSTVEPSTGANAEKEPDCGITGG